jgi:ribosomal protein S18 acetylase RimI-like enzyme
MIQLRRISEHDVPRLRQIWKQNWGDEFMVVRGVVYHPEHLDGFIAYNGPDCVGEITYAINDGECEIVTLDSECEGQGLGTKLIHAVVEEAKKQDCRRVFLITTNDNLNALGFYQKRGFQLVRIHQDAVTESRKIKPSIPLIGMNNIPLRDEIELEIIMKA